MRPLFRCVGACRCVWNTLLSIHAYRSLAGVLRLSSAVACPLMTWGKPREADGWRQEGHAQGLQHCLKDWAHAAPHLCAGRTAPPRARTQCVADSFRSPQGVKLDGRAGSLPMMGGGECWDRRPLDGTIKHVTVSRQGQQWCVAFQGEMAVG